MLVGGRYRWIVACFLFYSFSSTTGILKEESIDIKPSGQLTDESLKLSDGVVCLFTYAAVGGTNEEWLMSIDEVDGAYTCKVERPFGDSYLFFMSFAASVLNHRVESAEVFDNSGALLQNEAYQVDDTAVKSKDGGFEGNLKRLTIKSKKV